IAGRHPTRKRGVMRGGSGRRQRRCAGRRAIGQRDPRAPRCRRPTPRRATPGVRRCARRDACRRERRPPPLVPVRRGGRAAGMSSRRWVAAATVASGLAATMSLVVVALAQRHYERAFAFRIAGTTAAYISAVTPPPPPPPPPRPPRVSRARGRRAPVPPPAPPPPPPSSIPASRSYELVPLLTQSRALRTLPGWSSDVEVYFGTAPLVDATTAPLSPDDLAPLAAGGRWRDGAALVPLKDRDGQEVVGAVAVRPHPAPHGPLPGGFGFAFPAAILAVTGAAVIAFRERSLRRGAYMGAAMVLALATYLDVRWAARDSTDRWLVDTRRLLQEAATRLPPPRVRVAISDLAALVRDGEVALGEPAESAPRRVRVDGERRAVVAVLIGSGRWVELRSVPAELEAPRWLLLLLPCALLGPMAMLLLRWAERPPARPLRDAALPALMLTSVWAHMGGQMLVFLAGLQAIPQAYLDSARVDGAGAWRGFWRVTLPLLRPVTWFVVLTGLLGAFEMFALVFVLTQGGPFPARATDVLVHRVYAAAFGAQAFAVACAIAVVFAAVLLLLTWPQLAILRRE